VVQVPYLLCKKMNEKDKLIVDDDNTTQDNTQVQDYATLMLELIDTKKQLMEYEEQQTHYFKRVRISKY